MDWLTVCMVLRASGMPVPTIREYTELVRQGTGNEKERLSLLRRHKRRVAEQMRALTECQDLINYKVGVYEDILGR